MTPVDHWAVIAAFLASGALGLRANMLKPALASWKTAPDWVWLSISLLSITLATIAISIAGGNHASAREAALFTVMAVVAVTMLANLIVNGRNAPHAGAPDQDSDV